MRYTNFFLIFLSCSIFISLNTFAQTLTATQGTGGLSAQQFLIDNFLEGECVQISNVSYSGSNQAIGYFTYGTFEGIILSTGRITDAVGDPGDGFLGTGAANTQLGQPGDAQLTNLVNNDTHDAAIIEFDFVPTANTVTFGYRFASEEYPDYVGSQFNDVFAFAISGPGIVGVQNMAQLPGAAGIVSINNVNCCSNATYYNGEGGGGNCNNDCGNGLPGQEYNGMTDLLVATATVQACQTYHLKIAIADVGDEILDSAVFLQAQSFDAGGGSIAQAVGSTGSGTASTYEDCTQGYFVVKRAQGADNTSPMVVTFNVGGTATPNIDYQGTMPTSVTIPANQDSIIIPVNALADALAEGTETITLQVTSGGCACAAGNPPIVMNIIDNPPITVSIAPQNICPGQLATLTASASGGLPFPSYNYVWSPGGATTASITGAPASTTTYTVTVSDICGNTASASTTVTVSLPTATAANSGLACQSGTINLSSSGGTSYAWNGANSFSSAQQNPTITLPNNIPAGNYTYTVTVTSASGCTATATTTVVVTAVTATANNNGPVCNTGGNVTLNASGGTVYAWNDGGPPTIATTASTTISVPAGTPSGSYPYYVTVTNANGCSSTTQTTVTVNSAITPTFTAIPPFCSGDAAPLLPATSNNGITGTWNPAAVSNTTAATYTFTPNTGQCATTAILTTTITPPTTPTFAAIPPFCSGDVAPLLPATSNNGITGTWNPTTVSNTTAATYTFTPNIGQCATTATLATTITPPTTPTFTAIPPFCSGDAAPLLPATSNNGITGAWNPAAVSNTTAATYTFTPNIGQCATTATLTTTINPPTTPTFTAIPPFCSGDAAPLLPATANNGITGTWNPTTVSNTAAATYTFTPNIGQCATTAILTTTITPPTTPTFTAIPPFCSGDAAPLLPATSNNGITGAWNPATVSNTAAATYTFTPNAGQCATSTTLTTTITPPTTPTFTAIPPFCSGDAAPLLPATANNGITGTWNPATVSNTAAATYTFTPNAGQCATSTTLTTTITPPTTPTFTAIPPFCSGDVAPLLPATANNGITGTWNPATVSNTAAATYTFTPNAGQCATTATLTTTITPPTTPTFTAIPPFCSGDVAPLLPATANNGITGTWNPATVSNTAAATYTFTPNAGQCATTATLTTTITPPTTPTFTAIPPFCSGDVAPLLPATANNGITGTWNPAAVSNTAAAAYTFTPNAGQCATTATLTTTITPPTTPTFTAIPPFCSGDVAPLLPATANNGITGTWNPATVSNTAAATYTFTPNAGQCATTATLTTAITPPTTPTFTAIPPFCSGDVAPLLPATANNGITGTWNPAAVSNTAAATYTFTPNAGQCATTATLTSAITLLPTITLNTTCGATPFNGSGSITATASVVGGGILEYSIDGVSFQASNVFNNLSNGAYTITVRVVGAGCTETATTSVNCACTPPTLTVTDPTPICQNANGNATINLSTTITSNTGTTPTYYTSLALANAGGAGDVANPAAVGSGTYYIRSNNPTDASCYVTQAVTVVINPLPPAAINPVTAVCQDQAITLTATGGTTYNWAGTGIGNTSANPQNISNLTPNTNTYTVTVTDSNNCSATATVNATINPIPTTTNTTTPNTACIAPFNGGINLSVTPAASYQFNWSNNATSEDLTGINDDTYTVTITNPTTACSTTTTVTVADNSAAPNTTNTTTPNTACTSPFNGGINLSVTPTASYQFNWSNAATTEDLTAIEDGIYTVTITNPTTACSTTTTVTVADNSAAPNTTNTTTPNTACTSPFNGGINLSVTPAASYQFNWSNAATTEDLTAIEDGTYTVTVTNPTTACSTTTTVTVADNTVLPTASISGTTSICSGDNANITFTGTPNATVVYTLNGNTQTLILGATGTSIINTGIITNTRTYALVSITSEAPLSCTQTLTGSAIVTLNNLPIVTLNTDCGANPFNGGGSIIVDATVVGGGTLEYSIDGTNFQAANTFANLTNGAYTITVRVVGSDCVATASVNVSCACTAPNLTIVPPSAICQNLSGNATLNLTTSITTNTGTSPTYYTSLALANAGGLGDVANPTAVGSGTYYIRSNNPTDATCFTVQPVTVTINALPTTSNVVTPNTACSAPFDGAIDLTVTPAASYQFNWSNTSTNEDLVGIDDATYTVTVTNTNTNCSTTTSIVVGDASAAPTTSNLVTPNTACSAPFDGGIDLTVTPAASYQFNWSNTNTNEDLVGIDDATYTVTVTNTATNCSTTTSIVVADNSAAPTTSNLVTPNTACSAPFDGAIDLTVTPAASYQFNWSNTSTNEDLVGIDDATYTVTVTNTATNCSTTTSIVVGDASAAPTTSNVVTPNTACSAPFDGAIDLTVTPAASYQFNWSNSSTNEDLVGIDDTTYTVTVTNTATNCSTTTSIVVGDASAAPTTSNLVTPNTACSAPFDGGIDLTVTPAASYQFNWSNASINEDLVGIDDATYTVTVTNTATNCSTTASIVVGDASAAPTPAINGTTTYCLGETATPLTASGGNSYQWSTNDLTNQITPATTTAATTTYTVTVTNSGNCTATTSVTVTVNALPTLSLAVDCGATPINGSGVITATATIIGGNGTLEYAIDGVNFQANNTFSSLINGAYTVTVSVIETGCTTTETINVSCACTAPTLTVADPAPICQNANNNATLDLTTSVTSNTGTTPTYYTTLALANAGGAGDVVNPTAVSSGTYYVRSNNTADPTCFTVEPITVTINALPTPNINAVEPICEGESVTLTATGGTAYVWSSGGGNAATATYNSLNATTTYTVTATGANTCSATATVTVTVQNCGCVTPAAPTAINPNQAICAGETLPTFTANPAPNTAINWYDAPNGGNLIGTGNTFTPTVAGTYYAEAINIPADACQSPRIAFTLTINPLPIALFILDEVICTNQTATITFNGTPTTNATYAWAIEDNPLQTGSTATATWATTGQKDVTLTVTTDAGCTAQTTQSIGVSDVTASTIADQSIILGSSIALPVTAQSGLQGALTYTWTPTDGSLSCNNCINPAASPTQTTTYTILVADEFGCQTTDNVTVAVMQENTLIIPNAFSPNNDGTNDVFHINGANIAEFTMAIFDRWGQKVYETKATNLSEGWNGLYPDGKAAELGVYVYQLTVSFSDGKTEFAKGNISLLW